MNINIIGAGTWGISLALLLHKKKHNIEFYQRNSSRYKNLIKTRVHTHFPKHEIPSKINFLTDFNLLDLNNYTIIALTSDSINDLFQKYNFKSTKLIIATKGFDIKSGKLISELLIDKFKINKNNLAFISGPNHSEEVVSGKATASVIASTNEFFSSDIQNAFSSKLFRIYTTDDIVGVQLGGAIKNVVAIASGILIGLNHGDNAQAALISRGMNEMMTLSAAYNYRPSTMYGLSGLGDLLVTCYSTYSRNRQLGILLSKGMTLEKSINKIGMVTEGVNSCKILFEIINQYNSRERRYGKLD